MSLLQTLVDGFLQLDPETQHKLQALSGKIVALELREWQHTFYLAIEEEGLRLLAEKPAQTPNTHLRTTLAGLAQLGLSNDSDALFSGAVEIQGDIALGQQLRDILADLDIDWEELLARWTGDNMAHWLGNNTRSAWSWGKKSLDSLFLDMGEFLREERREVPSQPELDLFLEEVDVLRADADRLAARVARITQRMATSAASQE